MALTSTKTSVITGQSKVGDTIIAYLNANLQADGTLSITRTIPDVTIYTTNQTAVDADVAAFETAAVNMAKGE